MSKAKRTSNWVAVAEKLAKQHGGIIPVPKWLGKSGYSGLYQVMKKNPSSFAHIRQQGASEAAHKAWKTRKYRAAAAKAWDTIRAQESQMSPAELKALHLRRVKAAKKGWRTIRAKAA